MNCRKNTNKGLNLKENLKKLENKWKKQFEDWPKVKWGDTINIQNWKKSKDRVKIECWVKYGMKGKSWNGRSNPKLWHN